MSKERRALLALLFDLCAFVSFVRGISEMRNEQ